MQGWFFFHFRFKTSESVALQVDHWEVGSWGMYPRSTPEPTRPLRLPRPEGHSLRAKLPVWTQPYT